MKTQYFCNCCTCRNVENAQLFGKCFIYYSLRPNARSQMFYRYENINAIFVEINNCLEFTARVAGAIISNSSSKRFCLHLRCNYVYVSKKISVTLVCYNVYHTQFGWYAVLMFTHLYVYVLSSSDVLLFPHLVLFVFSWNRTAGKENQLFSHLFLMYYNHPINYISLPNSIIPAL